MFSQLYGQTNRSRGTFPCRPVLHLRIKLITIRPSAWKLQCPLHHQFVSDTHVPLEGYVLNETRLPPLPQPIHKPTNQRPPLSFPLHSAFTRLIRGTAFASGPWHPQDHKSTRVVDGNAASFHNNQQRNHHLTTTLSSICSALLILASGTTLEVRITRASRRSCSCRRRSFLAQPLT